MLALAFLSVFVSAPAWSVLPVECIHTAGTPGFGRNFNDIAAAVEEAEVAPFAYACQEPGAIDGRPKTEHLSRKIPKQDAEGQKTTALLERLLKKIEDRVSENENMANVLNECLSPRQAHPTCKDAQIWAQETLPKTVNEARYHLALSQSPASLRTWLQDSSEKLNSDLDSPGIYKEIAWEPLTESERKVAQKSLNEYRAEIEAETRKLHPNKNSKEYKEMVSDSILKVRYVFHHKQYQGIIAELPFLQYISSANPSPQHIREASQKLLANIQREKEFLKDMRAHLDQAKANDHCSREKIKMRANRRKCENISHELLRLLNYSSLLEETLLENPEYCGLATNLVYTSLSREIGNTVLVGLPIMAISFIAPPAVALVGGLGAGGAFIAYSQIELNRTKKRSLSQVYADPASGELEDLKMLEDQRNLGIITLPLGLGLGSMAISKGTIAVRSAIVGAKSARHAEKLRPSVLNSTVDELKKAVKKATSKREVK